MNPAAYFDRHSGALNRALGAEEVRLTRPSQLFSSRNEAPNAFELSAAALAGATSISLRENEGLPLSGKLLAGSKLTLAGAVYTVGAEVTAAGVSITVTITPPLAANAAEGATVAFTSGPSWTWTNALVLSTARRDHGGDPSAELYLSVDLPVLNSPATPLEGDSLLRVKDGSEGRVSRVHPENAGSWRVEVGAV